MRWIFSFLTAALPAVAATAALAEEDGGRFSIGSDSFHAAQNVTFAEDGQSDLFLIGERVTATSDIGGTAHLAGRWLTLSGDIGGNAYAMGQEIALTGAVGGNASLIGQEVTVGGPVAGNLRASASELTVTGDVGGYAMLAGEQVRLDSAIAGDAALTARRADFGPGARVAGILTIYEDRRGSLTVPASVAPESRIERRRIEAWEGDWHRSYGVSWRGALGGFLFGVLVVAGVAALIAALLPEALAAMRRRILDRPGRTLGAGFVALSAIAGAGLVVALTGIGLLLTPAFFLLAVLAGFIGYVVGAYAFGVGLLSAAGRALPDSIGDRALAAGVGALAAGLIGLVPVLGWFFVLLVLLTGLGALALRLLPDHLQGAPRY